MKQNYDKREAEMNIVCSSTLCKNRNNDWCPLQVPVRLPVPRPRGGGVTANVGRGRFYLQVQFRLSTHPGLISHMARYGVLIFYPPNYQAWATY